MGTSNNEIFQVNLTENFEVDSNGKFSFENSKPSIHVLNKWAPKSKTFLGIFYSLLFQLIVLNNNNNNNNNNHNNEH